MVFKVKNDFRSRFRSAVLFLLLWATVMHSSAAMNNSYRYAVVISVGAYDDDGWKEVADSLMVKHSAVGNTKLFTWTTVVHDVLQELSEYQPDYIGFIARPVTECNSRFIVDVSKMCRTLDDDPYGDAVWGIITGYEAGDALRALHTSLEVKTVLCASANLSYEPPIQRFQQAIGMTCDSYTKTDYLFPGTAGKVHTENRRPGNENDRINIIGDWLSKPSLSLDVSSGGTIKGPVDCIITGGHGNVNMWQCHYPEAGTEGYMQSSGGQLYGAPYSGSTFPVTAVTPKIYWCASNCLMGNPDGKDNVVYAAFHSGYAVQMFGFVNNASSGDEFMAWGTYDRVTKCAGELTLPQAFFLSNNNSLFEIKHSTGQMNTQQVAMFLDSTVFYGDPAGDVAFVDMGDTAKAYTTDLTYTVDDNGKGTFECTYTMIAHGLEFGIGYCYQFRPISILPARIKPETVVIESNEGHEAVITDNLLIWEMLSSGEKLPKGESRTLTWTAAMAEDVVAVRNATPGSIVVHAPVCVYHTTTRQLSINGLINRVYRLDILTLSGSVVQSVTIEGDAGGNAMLKIPSVISGGTYLVVLSNAQTAIGRRIVLQ